MRLMIGFAVDIPDDLADKLIKTAGPQLDQKDHALALALAALTPFPAQMREYLMAPDHDPIPAGEWRRLTTDRSAITIEMTISTQQEINNETPEIDNIR